MFEVDEEIDAAFQGIVRERYLQDKVRHYEEASPERFKRVGEDGFKQFAELALRKAESYNMLAEREVNGLESMMYFLGSGFDADALFPWARFRYFPDKDMSKREEPESYTHLKQVYERFYAFFTKADGTDKAYRLAARERLQTMRVEDFAAPRNAEGIVRLARDLYPERYALLPESALYESVLPQVQYNERDWALSCPAGTAMHFCAAFLAGSAFCDDPLHPDAAALFTPEYKDHREKLFFRFVRHLLD